MESDVMIDSKKSNPVLTDFDKKDAAVLAEHQTDASNKEPDWESLASSDAGNQPIDVEQVNSAIEARLSEVRKLVNELRTIETAFARQTALEFSQWRQMSIHDKSNEKEFGSLITRVVRKGKSLSLQWLTISYMKARSGGTFARSKYIPKITKGFNYPTTVFNNAVSWERQIVFGVERRYGLIRERWNLLSTIDSTLSKYDKRLSDPKESLVTDLDEE